MSLETAALIHQLNPANPSGSDRLANGDDHIRMIKAALKATFPNVQGPVELSHTFLNGLSAFLVPVGAITLWSGAAAPSGWAICNGQTVARSDGSGNITTPDLRDRVPVGSSATRVLGATFGQAEKTITTEAAGGHTHTASAVEGHKHNVTSGGHALTIAQMPAHTHTLQLHNSGSGTQRPEHGSGSAGPTAETSSTGQGQPHSHPITEETAGGHTHTLEAHAGHGHQVKVDVTQPSIALHFIMKV